MTGYVTWYQGEARQDWQTPHDLFDKLHTEFRFTLDGAASSGNALLPLFSSTDQPLSWQGHRVFCNPPWSDIRPFIDLAAMADLAVLLVPARVNARWFHHALKLGAGVRYLERRPRFLRDGIPGSTSPVDCLLLIFSNSN